MSQMNSTGVLCSLSEKFGTSENNGTGAGIDSECVRVKIFNGHQGEVSAWFDLLITELVYRLVLAVSAFGELSFYVRFVILKTCNILQHCGNQLILHK